MCTGADNGYGHPMTESRPEQPTDHPADRSAEQAAEDAATRQAEADLADDPGIPSPRGDRPQQDASDATRQQENAATSLDQPSQ